MNLSNKDIIHKKGNGIEYIQFKKLLEYKIPHAYILGLDKNFRTAMSKGQSITEQEYETAIKSYKILCNELDLNYNNIVKSNQSHTDNIEIIENKINKYAPDFTEYPDVDGLITNKNEFILSTTNADCILLLFYDPVKKVIANVHSGWRGTLQRISVKAVKKIIQTFNCKPQDIICCICPSIRKCHFEVDKDVYEMFYNEFQNLENLNEIIEKRKEKWHIDTVLINKEILTKEGIKEENIIDSGICSVCNKDIIHSYRAEGKNYGLSTAIISLYENKKFIKNE